MIRQIAAMTLPLTKEFAEEMATIQRTSGDRKLNKGHVQWLRARFDACNNFSLPATVLKDLMAHRSIQTTMVYLNLAERLRPVAHNLHVPAALADGSVRNGSPPSG